MGAAITSSPTSKHYRHRLPLQALALLFLKLHAEGAGISLVPFGIYNLLIGYLILRSTFIPRALGVLLAISGLCYVINRFANFISPAFAAHLLPYILLPGSAELLLAVWLVVKGVNVQRWNEQAGSAGVPSPGTMRWQQESA